MSIKKQLMYLILWSHDMLEISYGNIVYIVSYTMSFDMVFGLAVLEGEQFWRGGFATQTHKCCAMCYTKILYYYCYYCYNSELQNINMYFYYFQYKCKMLSTLLTL